MMPTNGQYAAYPAGQFPVHGYGMSAMAAPYAYGPPGFAPMYPGQPGIVYPAMGPHPVGYAAAPGYPNGYPTGGLAPPPLAHVGTSPRYPHPHPNVDPDLPALNMTNSTGGVGCEPGYNYFFPARHCKVHVMRSRVAPWQLPPNAQIEFKALHVPVSTTIGELMRGLGASNPEPKKNHVYEVCQGGNGRWYKGLHFRGDDKTLDKAISTVG